MERIPVCMRGCQGCAAARLRQADMHVDVDPYSHAIHDDDESEADGLHVSLTCLNTITSQGAVIFR